MADLKDALPKTWSSPTMSPHCADETKYGIVEQVVKHFQDAESEGREGCRSAGPRSRHGQRRARHRAKTEAGDLSRASSNKPELVVVVESPVVRTAHARHVRGDGWRCYAPIRKSASTIRRSDAGM